MIGLKNKRVIIIVTALIVLVLAHTAQAEPVQSWESQLSSHGSSYTTLVDGRLEFILMDGWALTKGGNDEYIITTNMDGELKEIGGIEVLNRGRSGSPSKIFTNLKDSGGNYILIEDKLLDKEWHSQYLIKWIKDKKYYVDIYIMNTGATSYHITLAIELKYFEKVYKQFEGFLATLDVRKLDVDTESEGYYNNVDKYLVHLPDGWQADNRNEFAGTTFTKPDTGKLYIYKQELNGITPNTYIWYSNKKIFEGTADIQLLYRSDKEENGTRIVEYMWTRPAIETIEQDFNYYWEINIIPQSQEYVLTYLMKTDKENMEQAFGDYQTILSSFTPTDYNMAALQRTKSDFQTKEIEINLEGNGMQISIPEDKTLWGVFSDHTPGDYLNDLKKAEADLGHKFEFVMTYSSFDTEFPEKDAKEIYADGRVMMLTLHPWSYGNTEDIMIPGIVRGDYDEYIKRWAAKIKELDGPLFFRFGNEMNGDWDPWCAWFFGKDQDLYIQAWRRIYNLFKEAGADNAYFVWNPHDRSFPDFKWNNPHLYYPGDEYVDWIGLTGYNNGTSYDWDEWRDFEAIYGDIYHEYVKLYPDKPLIITEFASNEAGGKKADWIREAFNGLAYSYPRIKIAVWFNQVDGRWEYPIDSSPAAKAAFLNGLKQNRFRFNAIKK